MCFFLCYFYHLPLITCVCHSLCLFKSACTVHSQAHSLHSKSINIRHTRLTLLAQSHFLKETEFYRHMSHLHMMTVIIGHIRLFWCFQVLYQKQLSSKNTKHASGYVTFACDDGQNWLCTQNNLNGIFHRGMSKVLNVESVRKISANISAQHSYAKGTCRFETF